MGGAVYADVIDDCWSRGGHMPLASELAEMIQHGLPNGSDTWLWTADSAGFSSPQFLQTVLKWTGTDITYPYWYSGFMTWAWKYNTDTNYRCVYYPIDPAYEGPTEEQCNGACTEFALPGGSGAKLWVDQLDRIAVSWQVASDLCSQDGGRLPQERDLAEAIQHGLDNGTDAWLWTTDISVGAGTTTNAQVVKWSGTDLAYTGQYNTYMTWVGFSNTFPYRCVWTNEVR
jgi:hypothetical protein